MIARALLCLLSLMAMFGALRSPVALAQPVAPPPPAPVAPAAPAPADSAAEVPTLRFSLGYGTTGLDPHSARDPITLKLCAAVYDTLYTYAPGPEPVILPSLATGMPKVSADGLTWTIKLRTDAKFHNSTSLFGEERTRALTATDVVNSIKRLAIKGPDISMYWLVGGIIKGLDAYGEKGRRNMQVETDDETVEGLTAPDATTVVFKLTRPFGGLLTVLAHPCTGVIATEAIDTYGDGVRVRPIGTGPYRLNAIASGRLVVLKRFDDYWGEKPHYQRIVFAETDDFGLAATRFGDGKLDRLDYLSDSNLELLQPRGKSGPILKKAGVLPEWADESGQYFMVFNMEDATWGAQDEDGRLLRKAVSLALDRALIIKEGGFTEKWARPAHEGLPVGSEFADLASQHSLGGLDAKAAREALDKSKYKGGIDPATGAALTLEVALANNVFNRALVKALQDGLKPLGITATARYVRGDYRNVVRTDSGQAFFGGWFLDSPDPQNFLQLLYGPNTGLSEEYCNSARYQSEAYDKLYKEFEGLLPSPENLARRRELVDKLLAQLALDRPYVPLIVRKLAEVRSKRIAWVNEPRATYNELRHLKPAKTE